MRLRAKPLTAQPRAGLARPRGRKDRTLVQGQITIDKERCKGCTFCIEFCPSDCIAMSEELNLKGYYVAAFQADAGCNGCGTCALMCPEVAIEVVRL